MTRYGIIGTGMIGHEHVRNLALRPGAEVTAYADPARESRWWTRPLLGDGAREYDDHRELLRHARVEGLVITSPNHTHAAVLDDVLAAGAHPGSTFVEHQRFRRAIVEGLPPR